MRVKSVDTPVLIHPLNPLNFVPGNIALHIFSEEARQQYDIESLWSVGRQYDRECNKPDYDLVEMLENHTLFLKDLTPNTTNK